MAWGRRRELSRAWSHPSWRGEAKLASPGFAQGEVRLSGAEARIPPCPPRMIW